MSLSNGKVSSDVCTRHVYPITTCVMTPVSDLVMLFFSFFFSGGREQRCMTSAGGYYYLSFNDSEWKDWRWQFISSHGGEVSILSNNWTWTAKDRKQKGWDLQQIWSAKNIPNEHISKFSKLIILVEEKSPLQDISTTR